jgi:hypothetical protein
MIIVFDRLMLKIQRTIFQLHLGRKQACYQTRALGWTNCPISETILLATLKRGDHGFGLLI